jgi:phospholipid-binding lipoprotein MlaA
VGSAVDSYDDPFTIVANDHGVTELTTARFVVGGVEERADVLEELDAIEKNSVDFYAEMRSLAQQHRAAELKNGKAPDAEPDLYVDPGKAEPAKPGAAKTLPAPAASKAPPVRVAARVHAPAQYRAPAALLKRRSVSRCAAPRCAAPKA